MKIDYIRDPMNSGWNVHKIEVFLLSLTLLFLALVGARAHAETRIEVIESLQTWKIETQARTDLAPREKDLRLDFIDRLVFQTERKYQEGPLKEFLLVTLQDMADTDDLASNQSFGSMSEFLINLQESLKDLLEQKESPIRFLQRFTHFSSIQNPRSPDEFAETRSYWDGKHLSSASPQDLEQAADFLEQKEKREAAEREAVESAIFHQELVEQYQIYPIQTL